MRYGWCMEQRLCACGCGEPTRPYARTNSRIGQKKGEFAEFVRGHYRDRGKPVRRGKTLEKETPCRCGCGELTRASYVSGHNVTRGETEFRDGVPWKRCQKCGEWKSVKEGFYPRKNSTWGNNPCKKCLKKYQVENAEKIRAREKLRRFKKHGHDEEFFLAMWESQGRACAICRAPYPIDSLQIDHDHSCCPAEFSCGKCVRGLLCSSDNVGIGHFGEDPVRLEAASRYIINYREVSQSL